MVTCISCYCVWGAGSDNTNLGIGNDLAKTFLNCLFKCKRLVLVLLWRLKTLRDPSSKKWNLCNHLLTLMLFLTNMYNFLLQNTKEDILKEHWGPKHGTPLAFIVWTDRQKFLQVCTKMRVSKFLGQLPLCGIVELEKNLCHYHRRSFAFLPGGAPTGRPWALNFFYFFFTWITNN